MDTRQLAKETYVQMRAFSGGHAMSLEAFSLRSAEILGEHVPLSTMKSWSSRDGWSDALIDVTFEGSAELRNMREVLDIWTGEIFCYKEGLPETKPEASDLVAAASAYRKIVRKLPKGISFLIEEEIEQVRTVLLDFVLSRPEKPSINARYFSTASGIWTDLGSLLYQDAPHQGGEVDADELILSPGR
jgi:hypothetical protein